MARPPTTILRTWPIRTTSATPSPTATRPENNIEHFGYTNWSFVGENIAAGQETAKAVMDAWKSSPEHDRNMRNKNFTEIGIGRAYDKSSKYGWYWTTTFGSR